MSLTTRAAALVIEAGAATADDILPKMAPATRPQVLRALKAALDRGLIDSDGWAGPSHGGSKPATYRAIRKAPVRRVSFVFELAAHT